MARILLYTVDVDVPGNPVNGGVLRVRQLQRLLQQIGHEVIVSMPLEIVLEAGAQDDIARWAYPTNDVARIAREVEPEIVLCEQWHLVAAVASIDTPIWLDLHGSLLAENAFRHAGGSEAVRRYGQEVMAKLGAFERADAISCTGQRQRLYFRGWRAIAGGTYLDWKVTWLPLTVAAAGEAPAPAEDEGLRFVYAGNMWPWIKLGTWLPSLLDVLAERPADQLHFFVDDPLNRRSCAEAIAADGAGKGYDRMLDEGRLVVSSRVGHEEFCRRARDFDIALDLFAPNSERELALTSRTVEYLALGLPVLYPEHAELAAQIAQQRCGWLVDPEQPSSLRQTLLAIDEAEVRDRTVAARARAALSAWEDEASQRCGGIVRELLESDRRGAHSAVERRFSAAIGARTVVDLRQLQTELKAARETSRQLDAARAEAENRCLEQRELIDAERAQREREVAQRQQEVAQREQEVAQREQWINEIKAEVALDACRQAEQTRRQDRLAEARQMAAVLRASQPGRARRGLRRRLRLVSLYLDHILVRIYLSVWQRIRRTRIFPGM